MRSSLPQSVRRLLSESTTLTVKRLRPYYLVSATRGGRTLWLRKSRKFGTRQTSGEPFASQPLAVTAAKAALRKFPTMESWQIDVRIGFRK